MLRRQNYPNAFQLRWPVYATLTFMVACFLLGGASRSDVIQHALLRPLALVLAVTVICFVPRIDWRAISWPGCLLLALGALMVVQLIPLPWSVWTSLPARDLAQAALELTGQDNVAHAWSFTPDRTLNSLFALTVPMAMLTAMAALGTRQRRLVLVFLVGAIMLNMLMGFLQLVQGRFYFYDVTNLGSAVGFFANRNHNAALIAASLPMLACIATWPVRKPSTRPVLWLVAGGLAVLSLLAILSIGSRWGLAMAAVGLVWALIVAWRDLAQWVSRQSKAIRYTILAAPVILVLALAAVAIFASRDETLRRLSDTSVADDTRVQTLPATLSMMQEQFPVGSGFGSFETLYRAIEAEELLSFQYLNHVHNDYVELMIEAGLAGLIILVAALFWYLTRLIGSFRSKTDWFVDTIDRRIAQAAGGVVLIAGLASITDYPVRTPIWMMVLAACAVWLAGNTKSTVPKMDSSTLHEYASSQQGSA